MELRLRASLWHIGQVFFKLFVPDPPQGDRLRGGGVPRKGRSMKKNLVL